MRGFIADGWDVNLSSFRPLTTYNRRRDMLTLRPAIPSDVPNSVIAEWDGAPAGFALYFYSYSTWEGRASIYLEDLFVRPEFRGKGIGKALLTRVATIAVAEGCARFEWSVLDWNQPSVDFYHSIGAVKKSEWLGMKVTGEALTSLAAQAVAE
jgi:GNAT superfamily N-acetyltransferase